MANHKSALKAHRQSLKRRSRNRSNRSSLRSYLKSFKEQIDTAKTPPTAESLSKLYALIDRSAQKKALSKNAASRQKSRLTKRLNAALASPKQL